MIELVAVNLHFKDNSPRDLCLHGGVVFGIDDTVISNGKNSEWCVSASALMFLRTLYNDHFLSDGEKMIPCCGHFMIPSEDGEGVIIIGCENGIDFDVTRRGDKIIVSLADGSQKACSYDEYKKAVMAFAKQIDDFYKRSPSRIPEDDFSARGFEAFKIEISKLINKIV